MNILQLRTHFQLIIHTCPPPYPKSDNRDFSFTHAPEQAVHPDLGVLGVVFSLTPLGPVAIVLQQRRNQACGEMAIRTPCHFMTFSITSCITKLWQPWKISSWIIDLNAVFNINKYMIMGTSVINPGLIPSLNSASLKGWTPVETEEISFFFLVMMSLQSKPN